MRWIDEQADLESFFAEARTAPMIAVDTEADSLHSYFDKVCLIQATIPGQDVLIDPLSGLDLAPLGAVLGDPAVTKVLHGADYDLRILNRDFGFTITNLIDTMVCAQLLGYDGVGLAALLKRHFNLEVDKKHQRADWSQRPLSQELRSYAAMDTRHLIELASILRSELEALGRWEWAVEEFERLEQIRYREQEPDEESYRRIKGSARLAPRGLAVLQRLHRWRDERARELDRPPFKVFRNEIMLEIASTLPRDKDALSAIRGLPSWQVRRFGDDLISLVNEAMALSEAELPARSAPKRWIRDRDLEKRIDRLKKARDGVASELRIDSSLLAPKHVLTTIATEQPSSPEELERLDGMRRWQRDVVGAPLLAALRDR